MARCTERVISDGRMAGAIWAATSKTLKTATESSSGLEVESSKLIGKKAREQERVLCSILTVEHLLSYIVNYFDASNLIKSNIHFKL